jgi:hypothetical protein
MPTEPNQEIDMPLVSLLTPYLRVHLAKPVLAKPARKLALLAGAVCAALLAWRLGVHSAAIVRNAVCTANKGQVDCNSSGLGGITSAADALDSPILVALIAICPLACLIGAAAVMFGNRKGLIIIGSALGALVFAGAVKGIVA